LQLVISVSRLLGNVDVFNNSRMQESLSMINNFASSDKAMKSSRKLAIFIIFLKKSQ
jgi:dedicator of cytokinesis protein 9/10/11